MEVQNTFKNDTSQRQESPLDVLSRAASMIQKETSKMKMVERSTPPKEGSEKERSSDSSFENVHSSPQEMPSPVFSSSSKLTVHRDKRERRQLERKSTGISFKETFGKDSIKLKDDDKKIFGNSLPPNICRGDCKECNGIKHSHSHAEKDYPESTYLYLRDRIKVENEDHKLEKYSQSEEDRDHRSYRYPRIPPPPLISLHPSPFSWLPPPYPSPLSLVRRQSVIKSASCPPQYGGDEMSFCPCIDPKCNIQPYSFGKHWKSPAEIKREVFSAVQPGSVEEHFRKSLGSDYEEPAPQVESLNSVDEHFAKALGNTWYSIKYKNCVDSAFRTRERVLSGCNL